MNNQMKRVIFFALAMLVTMIVSGQELQVRSFRLAANDISAVKYQRLDLNSQPCALIKVGLGVQGAKFPGTEVVGDVKFDTGEYWVYVVDGTKKLKVMHNNYAPLYIDFSDYPEQRLEGGRTYVLILSSSQVNTLSNGVTPQATITSPKSEWEEFKVGDVSFKMIYVEGDTFTMGATPEMKKPDKDEKPKHQVTLSSYYIGETEVTNALWDAVMGDKTDSRFVNYPKSYISWLDCWEFIQKLNVLTGKQFRLPTEAEWEFAARGGKKSNHTQYSGSDNIDEVAWYWKGSQQSYVHPVALKKANELRLYDMSGNVSEWCQDDYVEYSRKAQTNPEGKSIGFKKVMRGGSYGSEANACRTSSRMWKEAVNKNSGYFNGFRLALSDK